MPVGLLILSFGVLTALGVVGVRLLVTGLGQRSVPELALAAFFLFGGAVTFGFDLAAREFLADSLEWQARFRTVSNLGARVPAVAIALFTWRVFRPTDRWAALLFSLIAGTMLVLSVNHLIVGHSTPGSGPAFWVGVLTTLVGLGWAMADSFAYYCSSVRRLTLGLTTEVVSNRFLLWSIWSGTAMLIVLAKVSTILLFDVDGPFTPARGAVTVFQSMVGLTCVTALTLTFYPPTAYKRWVESRAQTTLATTH
jgi:hypothetical protein